MVTREYQLTAITVSNAAEAAPGDVATATGQAPFYANVASAGTPGARVTSEIFKITASQAALITGFEDIATIDGGGSTPPPSGPDVTYDVTVDQASGPAPHQMLMTVENIQGISAPDLLRDIYVTWTLDGASAPFDHIGEADPKNNKNLATGPQLNVILEEERAYNIVCNLWVVENGALYHFPKNVAATGTSEDAAFPGANTILVDPDLTPDPAYPDAQLMPNWDAVAAFLEPDAAGTSADRSNKRFIFKGNIEHDVATTRIEIRAETNIRLVYERGAPKIPMRHSGSNISDLIDIIGDTNDIVIDGLPFDLGFDPSIGRGIGFNTNFVRINSNGDRFSIINNEVRGMRMFSFPIDAVSPGSICYYNNNIRDWRDYGLGLLHTFARNMTVRGNNIVQNPNAINDRRDGRQSIEDQKEFLIQSIRQGATTDSIIVETQVPHNYVADEPVSVIDTGVVGYDTVSSRDLPEGNNGAIYAPCTIVSATEIEIVIPYISDVGATGSVFGAIFSDHGTGRWAGTGDGGYGHVLQNHSEDRNGWSDLPGDTLPEAEFLAAVQGWRLCLHNTQTWDGFFAWNWVKNGFAQLSVIPTKPATPLIPHNCVAYMNYFVGGPTTQNHINNAFGNFHLWGNVGVMPNIQSLGAGFIGPYRSTRNSTGTVDPEAHALPVVREANTWINLQTLENNGANYQITSESLIGGNTEAYPLLQEIRGEIYDAKFRPNRNDAEFDAFNNLDYGNFDAANYYAPVAPNPAAIGTGEFLQYAKATFDNQPRDEAPFNLGAH